MAHTDVKGFNILKRGEGGKFCPVYKCDHKTIDNAKKYVRHIRDLRTHTIESKLCAGLEMWYYVKPHTVQADQVIDWMLNSGYVEPRTISNMKT